MSEHLRREWASLNPRFSSAAIRGYLNQVADMQSGMNQRADWKFQSVEALVLHYGREYKPAPLPESVEQGVMQQCYSNAMNLVMDNPDLTYVEGFGDNRFFPTGHGWATADGRTAIDPTWDDATGYFGIAFSRAFWSSFIAKTGYWGILFPEMGNQAHTDLLKHGLPPGALA